MKNEFLISPLEERYEVSLLLQFYAARIYIYTFSSVLFLSCYVKNLSTVLHQPRLIFIVIYSLSLFAMSHFSRKNDCTPNSTITVRVSNAQSEALLSIYFAYCHFYFLSPFSTQYIAVHRGCCRQITTGSLRVPAVKNRQDLYYL